MNLHNKKVKYNLTSKYLLPSIYLDSSKFPISTLELLGFVNCYLEDLTYKTDNTLILIFQPSVHIYNSEKWSLFMDMISRNNGLLNIIEYDLEHRIFGFQMKINSTYADKLAPPFKLGKYSLFPLNYIQFLGLDQQKVCKKDIGYRIALEKRLGLKEGFLIDMELEDVPEEKDVLFNYKKEKCKLQTEEI